MTTPEFRFDAPLRKGRATFTPADFTAATHEAACRLFASIFTLGAATAR